jgi:hypothetical protein
MILNGCMEDYHDYTGNYSMLPVTVTARQKYALRLPAVTTVIFEITR